MEAHNPDVDAGFKKRDTFYKVGIAVCLAAFAGSMIYYNVLHPGREYSVNATVKNGTLDLNSQTDAIKSRVYEAYVLEDSFCKGQDGIGTDKFAYSDASTSVNGSIIQSQITCHLKDGDVRNYELDFDQRSQHVEVSQLVQGPDKPT